MERGILQKIFDGFCLSACGDKRRQERDVRSLLMPKSMPDMRHGLLTDSQIRALDKCVCESLCCDSNPTRDLLISFLCHDLMFFDLFFFVPDVSLGDYRSLRNQGP